MFENLAASATETHSPRGSRSYSGPDRRAAAAASSALGHCLTCMLDEIDYGMLLVTADAQVVYLNHAARLELDGEHPLQMLGSSLRAHRPQDVAPLYDALASAQRGLRKLVTLGEGVQRVSVSVVPLPAEDNHCQEGLRPTTLLVLGKRQVCEQLSVQGFARSMHLTPAETRVLEHLCSGVRPTRIAQQQNVAVSTVRTQIGSIRSKTGAASISDLVRQVAVLPPLVGVLRARLMVGAVMGAVLGTVMELR
jgi:DNA-binding CsgD family transcriptional regulator